MNRIPNPSFDEAQAWLRHEIVAWRQITKDVPIEMSE